MPETMIHLSVGALTGGDDPYYPVRMVVAGNGAGITAALRRADAEAAITATRDVLLGGDASREDLRVAGRRLFALIVAGDIAVSWSAATAGHGQPVRIVLDMQPDELRALPWELALPDQGPYLFVGQPSLVARGSYRTEPGETCPVVPAVVLVVIGDTADELRCEEEVDAIHRAVGRRPGEWHVEVLRCPAQPVFFEVLGDLKPHVLHLLGHSRRVAHGAEAGLEIRLPNPEDTWWLTGDLVENLVPEAPRLVFLNACRTAAELELSRGVASVFADHGARAVVAMQGDLPSPSAVVFTHAVYEALAQGDPIDLAVRQGRQRLMAYEQPVQRDWALPTLSLRARPDEVLPVHPTPPDPGVDLLFDPYLDDVRSFVDRGPKHRELWNVLDPVAGRPTLVVLDGDDGAGKSTLMQRCLHTLCLQGRPVIYADLDESRTGTTLKWLNVLCRIRDAALTFQPRRAEEPARAFDRTVWFARHGRETDPREVAGPTPAGTVWNPQSEWEPELRKQVFAAFRAFLDAIGGADPLVLAVDHLRTLDPPDRALITAGLLTPLAARRDPLRVALVETSTTIDDILPESMRSRLPAVTLPLFGAEETIPVFREFGARRNRGFDGTWRQFAEAQRSVARWEPENLNWLFVKSLPRGQR